MSTIRAAFDLGSSNHKIIVARITPQKPPHILYSNSTRIPLADAMANHPNPPQTLPQSILHESHTTVLREKRLAESLGATSFCAIATHVFRTASNGPAHLHTLRQLGIRVLLLSQQEEGHLALLTALSTQTPFNPHSIVWDSGGGSTQWTYVTRGAIRVHPLQIGTAAVREAYAACNDRQITGVKKLVQWISARAPKPHPTLTQRFQAGFHVLGIGGQTSMFAIMAAHHGSNKFALSDVDQYVAHLLAASDQQAAHRILPKMVLLAHLMAAYDIPLVNYVPTNGSCLGLLASHSPRFWPDQVPPRNDWFFDEVVQGTSLTPRC